MLTLRRIKTPDKKTYAVLHSGQSIRFYLFNTDTGDFELIPQIPSEGWRPEEVVGEQLTIP